MATLYLIRGIPGSGKTSFSAAAFPGIAHFENDMWFMKDGKYLYDRKQMSQAIEWCFNNVKSCLENGIDAAVSNTFTKKRFIDSYKNLAVKSNSCFKVYRMMGEFNNVHSVPKNVMDSMKSNFEDYDGEMFAYPNLNQSKDDQCYRPYMLTELKVGDKIIVQRSSDHKLEHHFETTPSGKIVGDSCELEDCIATITSIKQGTYDYLNVSYVEDDTKHAGICMNGDCKKYNI